MPALPALIEIDPTDVARDVVTRIVDHLGRQSFQLAPFRPELFRIPPVDDLLGASDIALTTRAVVLYAQRGCPVWDWTDSGMALDGLTSLLVALYACPGRPEFGGGILDDAPDLEPEDDLSTVLLAAMGRIRIDQGADVPAREVGALSGVRLRRVQQLAQAGELEATSTRPMMLNPATADRWLGARGVPGFGGRR